MRVLYSSDARSVERKWLGLIMIIIIGCISGREDDDAFVVHGRHVLLNSVTPSSFDLRVASLLVDDVAA